MSKPDLTLDDIIKKMDAAPMSQDFELAAVEFLDLTDAEQKRILFKALVQTSAAVNYIMGRLGIVP